MLGYKVKDKITGITGVAVQKVYYLNGCTQYSVQPKPGKDGKLPESVRIDDVQLVKISKVISPISHHGKAHFEMMEDVKDTLTGLKGKVMAKTWYMDGTIRFGYQPKVEAGKTEIHTYWQDSEVLVSTTKKKPKAPKVKPSGGPQQFNPPTK